MGQVLPACCQLTMASRRSSWTCTKRGPGVGAESLDLGPREQEEVVLFGERTRAKEIQSLARQRRRRPRQTTRTRFSTARLRTTVPQRSRALCPATKYSLQNESSRALNAFASGTFVLTSFLGGGPSLSTKSNHQQSIRIDSLTACQQFTKILQLLPPNIKEHNSIYSKI